MKFTTWLFVCVFMMTILSTAQNNKEQFAMIEIDTKTYPVKQLAQYGLELDHAPRYNNKIQVVASEYDQLVLTQAAISFKIIQQDMATYYQNRLANNLVDKKTRSLACVNKVSPQYGDPAMFSLGSMGGYYTYEEAFKVMDSLAVLYPNILKARDSMSNYTTAEGRKLYWYKISDQPNIDEAEPEIQFNALHHAREAVTLSQLIYFMCYLCENYATNAEIKYLVDNTEIYFVPIVNPDGYNYNQQTDPAGGGMWRKNRRNNGTNFGVDLNRNYSLGWGFNNTGSSNQSNSNTYRGTAAASEPEVAAMQWFTNQHQFKIVQNCHSYTGLWIYPWGYLSNNCDDSTLYRTMGSELSKYNYFKYGIDEETVGYSTNGTSDDWLYGDASHAKILAATPEVGDVNDGFWPVQSRILPLCREMNYFNITSVKFLLPYAKLEETGDRLIGGNNQQAYYNLDNIGLAPNATFTLSLIPITNNITNVQAPKIYNNLANNVMVADSISYDIAMNTNNNSQVQFILQLNNGYTLYNDTITKYFGNKQTVFFDDCENFTKWNTGSFWGVENGQGIKGSNAIGDSPFNDYAPFANETIETKGTINFNSALRAEWRFKGKWATENNSDIVQPFIFNNGNLLFVCGKYTQPYIDGFSGVNSAIEAYTGINAVWRHESISLDDYLSPNLSLGYTITTDGALEMDGFKFDDVTVTILSETPSDIDNIQNNNYTLFAPNPNSGILHLHPIVTKLTIYNLQGQVIKTVNNKNGTVSLDNVSCGIYVGQFKLQSGEVVKKKLVVK
jgi:carboxypeptidase T